MAAHQRVAQIRAEAGLLSTPAPALATESAPEPEEVRNARLNELQRESLGSSRRDRISKEDFPENRRHQVSWKLLEAARLSSQPGTPENEQFRANEAILSKWNNAWTELEDDGTIEERFDDINHGQTHRVKLMSDPEIRREYGNEDAETGPRRHHADNSGRSQGGGRGGRGGGFAGSRSRGSGPKRVPVGMVPTATQGYCAPPPPFRAARDLFPRVEEGFRVVEQRVQPAEEGKTLVQPQVHHAGPLQVTNQESGWATALADPADFVTAFKRNFVPSAAPGTTARTAVAGTASVSSAVSPSNAAKTTGDSTGNHMATDRIAQHPLAGPTKESSNTVPVGQSPVADLAKQSLAAASPEQEPHTSLGAQFILQDELNAPHSSEEGSIASTDADEEPALIDFGDAFDQDKRSAFSHETGDESRHMRAISPPLIDVPDPEQSYSGDLLGLDIQPAAGQPSQSHGGCAQPQTLTATEDLVPVIAEIRDKISSFTPLLRSILKPESVKSLENIVTELELKSKSSARTTKAAPAIEPPTAAFGRLSLHEHDVDIDTSSMNAKDQTAAASSQRATVNPFGSAPATRESPEVIRSPASPAPQIPMVETASNVQQNKSHSAGYVINPPQSITVDVHDPHASVLTGASVSSPLPERNTASMTTSQSASLQVPAITLSMVSLLGTGKTPSKNDVREGPLPGHDRGHNLKEPGQPQTCTTQAELQSPVSEGFEESEEDYDYPLEAICQTIHPQSSGSTINRIGFYKGQGQQANKENVPFVGYRGNPVEASSSKPRVAFGGYSFTPRVFPGNVTANLASVPRAQTTAGNFLLPKTEMATAASSLGPKSDKAATAFILGPKAIKKEEDEEDEEDFPLDTVLTTTFVPTGPSRMNRSGFYKR